MKLRLKIKKRYGLFDLLLIRDTEALSRIRMQRNAASVEQLHVKKRLLKFILSSVEQRDHSFPFDTVLAEPGPVPELCVRWWDGASRYGDCRLPGSV